MKLVKITDDHYVIVDENAEIKEGDWYLGLHNKVIKATDGKHYAAEAIRFSGKHIYKITHSTQPLYKNDFWAIQELKLSEVKELIGEVDVKKKAINSWEGCDSCDTNDELFFINGYQRGYNQALEDNKEKKYTEEDMRKAIAVGYDWCHQKHIPTNWMIDNFIQSLQPKTEWDVEFDSQGKLKLL